MKVSEIINAVQSLELEILKHYFPTAGAIISIEVDRKVWLAMRSTPELMKHADVSSMNAKQPFFQINAIRFFPAGDNNADV